MIQSSLFPRQRAKLITGAIMFAMAAALLPASFMSRGIGDSVLAQVPPGSSSSSTASSEGFSSSLPPPNGSSSSVPSNCPDVPQEELEAMLANAEAELDEAQTQLMYWQAYLYRYVELVDPGAPSAWGSEEPWNDEAILPTLSKAYVLQMSAYWQSMIDSLQQQISLYRACLGLPPAQPPVQGLPPPEGGEITIVVRSDENTDNNALICKTEAQINLGSKDANRPQKIVKIDGTDPVNIKLPANVAHTIDIRPQDPSCGGITFRVEKDTVKTRALASPTFVTGPATVWVERPIRLPTQLLELADADQGQTKATLELVHGQTFYMPYAIDLYDSEKKIIRTFDSWSGNKPVLTDAQKTLDPGTYHVHVRPRRLHYPVTSWLKLSGGGKSARSVRVANLRPPQDANLVPVAVKAGQKLEIMVEEPVQSYNLTMTTFEGVPVSVGFPTPYLHMNVAAVAQENMKMVGKLLKKFNDPHDANAKANSLFGVKIDGAAVLAATLATATKNQLVADKEKVKQDYDMRKRHVGLVFGRNDDGGVPQAFQTLIDNGTFEAKLATFIAAEINKIMAQPYRTSDAMGVMAQVKLHAAIEGVPAAIKTAALGKVQAGPVHYTKNQAVADFYELYKKLHDIAPAQ